MRAGASAKTEIEGRRRWIRGRQRLSLLPGRCLQTRCQGRGWLGRRRGWTRGGRRWREDCAGLRSRCRRACVAMLGLVGRRRVAMLGGRLDLGSDSRCRSWCHSSRCNRGRCRWHGRRSDGRNRSRNWRRNRSRNNFRFDGSWGRRRRRLAKVQSKPHASRRTQRHAHDGQDQLLVGPGTGPAGPRTQMPRLPPSRAAPPRYRTHAPPAWPS